MSLFSKFFKSSSKSDDHNENKDREVRGKYMPELDIPADERFTKNFIVNGGRFLYALNMEEVQDNFDNILLENDWYESEVFCLDEGLQNRFKGYKNIVVFGTTSQIVNAIGEGLRLIKNRNAGHIPTNITTIKNFEAKTDEKDFMTYGSSTKNLYLLLLEDL